MVGKLCIFLFAGVFSLCTKMLMKFNRTVCIHVTILRSISPTGFCKRIPKAPKDCQVISVFLCTSDLYTKKLLVKRWWNCQSLVNFINVLRAPFLYESLFSSFSLVTFWLWWKYKSTYVQNSHAKNVDEIANLVAHFVSDLCACNKLTEDILKIPLLIWMTTKSTFEDCRNKFHVFKWFT